MSIFYKQEQETSETSLRNFEIGSAFGYKAPQNPKTPKPQNPTNFIFYNEMMNFLNQSLSIF